jgi:diguanylate cyclase (GGDEF)-like protein
VVALAVPALALLAVATRWRSPDRRTWRWLGCGTALLLTGAPGTWSLLVPASGPPPTLSAPPTLVPLVVTVLSAVGAYAVLFAGNLRLLHYQRSSVLPHVNAWFDGVASLAGFAAILSATAVPALTARGMTTTTALAWSVRPALLLVLVAFAAANCGLVGRADRRRTLGVLAVFAVLLAAELVDLVHLVQLGTGSATGPVAPAVAAGLRVLAVALLLRTVARHRPGPRVVVDLGWPTVAAPISVFCLTMTAAWLRTAHPATSTVAFVFEVVALTTVAAKLVLLTRLLVSLLGSHRLSLLDELTGLANRRAFFAEVDRVPAGEALAVLLLDLDGFKAVNDRFGHRTGDLLLRDTAARLEDVVGADGLAARLGGDEFVVLLTGADTARADAVAAELLAQLGPREVEGLHVVVGASIGVAGPGTTAPEDPAAAGRGRGEALLHAADVAMYRAKSTGGGARRAV